MIVLFLLHCIDKRIYGGGENKKPSVNKKMWLPEEADTPNKVNTSKRHMLLSYELALRHLAGSVEKNVTCPRFTVSVKGN